MAITLRQQERDWRRYQARKIALDWTWQSHRRIQKSRITNPGRQFFRRTLFAHSQADAYDGWTVIAESRAQILPNSGALVLEPVAQTITQLSVAWDMFCNAMTVLADGRVMVNGGTIACDPFQGIQTTSIFDPSFTNVQSMAHGRWYPSDVMLGEDVS
jgi:hypothetical protein